MTLHSNHCLIVCCMRFCNFTYYRSESTTFWNSRRTNKIKCAEFLSCSANTTPKGGLWRNSNSPLTWSKSPAKVTSNSRGFWSGLKTSLLGSNSRVIGILLSHSPATIPLNFSCTRFLYECMFMLNESTQ